MSEVTQESLSAEQEAGEAWRLAGARRCRTALAAASSAADRLALLRSWVRLQHGWLDLQEAGVALSAAEADLLGRFGLASSADGSSLRLNEHADDGVGGQVDDAIRLETSPRTLSTPATADAALRRFMPFARYRTPTQKSAVRALLTAPSGGSGLLVSMPTGSGKSLLFQLFALFERNVEQGACCVVITPTVSLALDHARTLSQIPGLENSQALTGEIVGEAREFLLAAFRRGEIPVLFMSPELALGMARTALLDAATPPALKASHLKARLSGFFVDEAHIIESWGRGFRPDFQRLPAFLQQLRQVAPHLPAILLSATLTPAARRELRRAYGLGGAWLEIDAHTPRYELDIVVRRFDDANQREAALLQVIDHAPRPAIVYTTQVADAAQLHRTLKARGYERIEMFTGDVSDPAVRRRIVSDWAEDRLDLVVATSAFGLGIDKADVRSVIHACLPEGPARWYQEIGRASRDGHQGLAACLFTDGANGGRSDVAEAARQATGSWLSRDLAEKRWKALIEAPVGSRVEGGERRLVLDLDSVREGLSVLQDNDYNRGWNMSLLNLLQRAHTIEVLSVAVASDGVANFVWEIAIRDPRILDPSDGAVWDDVFRTRNAELLQARNELQAFLSLMAQPGRRCLLAAVFELIEGDVEVAAPPCGRCPACRANDQRPPRRSPALGLEQTWSVPPRTALPCPLPGGLLILEPRYPDLITSNSQLLARLAAVGVEQFLVPDTHASIYAAMLADGAAKWGLVMSHSEWLSDAQGHLAPVPTALVLPPSDTVADQLLMALRLRADERPEFPYLIVARGDRMIKKRRIDQGLSRHSPYTEDLLANLASDGSSS